MSLKCGIVGLPNVGKSTLFNALSNAQADAANFPFCTIEPNKAIVEVPDTRLDLLESLVKPQRVVHAAVEIVDIAGLVRGASKGDGKGNSFLSHIRETDAILHVLRCFDDDNVIHVENSVDPLRDREIIEAELQLKDLESLEKRARTLASQAKNGNKESISKQDFVNRLSEYLLNGNSARSFERTEQEQEAIADLFLLTDKPVLYVCNVDEASLPNGNHWVDKVREVAAAQQAQVVVICAAAEEQIQQMEEPAERTEFLEMLGVTEPGLHQLIRRAYQLLGLQTYFTAGVKEVRAWTVRVGARAPQAAAEIHTDFEKHFIRAEVIGFDDYALYKTEAAAKEAGRFRVEGKEYVVQDGDVLHFRVSA